MQPGLYSETHSNRTTSQKPSQRQQAQAPAASCASCPSPHACLPLQSTQWPGHTEVRVIVCCMRTPVIHTHRVPKGGYAMGCCSPHCCPNWPATPRYPLKHQGTPRVSGPQEGPARQGEDGTQLHGLDASPKTPSPTCARRLGSRRRTALRTPGLKACPATDQFSELNFLPLNLFSKAYQ